MSNALYPTIRGLAWTVMASPEMSTIVHESPSGATTRLSQRNDPLWHFTLVYEVIKDHWDTDSPYNPYTDYEELQGFWLARYGPYDDFLLDCSILNMPIEWWLVTNQAQPTIGDNEGNWFTPLVRTWAGLYQESITDLNTGPTLTANGGLPVSVANAYMSPTLGISVPGASYYGLYLIWVPWTSAHTYAAGEMVIDSIGHLQLVTSGGISGGTIPTFDDSGGTTTDGGVTWTDQGLADVRATFTFYMRMRFEMDQQDFELFAWELWTVGGSESKNGSGQIKMVSSRVPIEALCV